MKIPTTINGIEFQSPLKCESKGLHQAIGTWYVEDDDCSHMPKWGKFKARRIVSRLWGLSMADDWKTICESTPAIIGGKFYERPAYCKNKAIGGVWGSFCVLDAGCNSS
ncbi:hypothetical protein FRC07_014935 [Ceratobasidium sp. 392]|nr:hypothetical protein FRC07_014935 [Ceratobasidium sp. 392]